MSTTIIAMYDNADKAQQVVNEIVEAGISRDRVEVLSGNGNGTSSVVGKLTRAGHREAGSGRLRRRDRQGQRDADRRCA